MKYKMEKNRSSDTVWHHATVTRVRRESLNAHRGVILWFTGLSGAGKSSLSHAVEEELFNRGCRTFVLDGDNIRHGLCSDLGFSMEDRVENIRRIGAVTKLFVDAGIITLTAFISPYIADRARARSLVPQGDFLEIYCNCPLEVCEERDVKGLYRLARRGDIQNFTGISSPYQEPTDPELVVDTGSLTLDESVNRVITFMQQRGVIDLVQ
ncbi:adenylyl-sulfate kinase [Undibacterium sp.]|uniref:adenylyl-sulfate kinase n=1 Tax=Undibacterium sp. TaxID=1914977 RepID=UPI00272CEB32|nr:adenylyl-sulfate kinase [Undibacterium sp.]